MNVQSNYAIAVTRLEIRTSFATYEKQNQNKSQVIRAISKLQVIAWNSDWFIGLFAPVVIGQSNYFGTGFSTVIKKRRSATAKVLRRQISKVDFFYWITEERMKWIQ